MIKVVVVEDEEIIRKGFIYTIDWMKWGCSIVDEAADGREGLEKIKVHHPDLVITDIVMPKMTGIEMLEEARKYCDFKSIILTSYQEFEYAQKAIDLKVNNYLLKPVDEEELDVVMEKIRVELNQKATYEALMGRVEASKEALNIVPSTYSGMGENYYVASVLECIQNDYAKKLSIEYLAEKLGVSTSYLSRKFKEETHQTFVEALNKYRIQKAVDLLKSGQYRICEVSDMTGFTEYKHFCSVFKKYVKMSPSDLQKNNKIAP